MSGQEDKIGIGILGAAGIAKKNARGISLTRNGLGECREITSSIYKENSSSCDIEASAMPSSLYNCVMLMCQEHLHASV